MINFKLTVGFFELPSNGNMADCRQSNQLEEPTKQELIEENTTFIDVTNYFRIRIRIFSENFFIKRSEHFKRTYIGMKIANGGELKLAEDFWVKEVNLNPLRPHSNVHSFRKPTHGIRI